jgi:hypothetical protein
MAPFMAPVPRHVLEKVLGPGERDERINLLLEQPWLLSPGAHSIIMGENGPTELGKKILYKLLETIGSKKYSAKRKLVLRPEIIYIEPGEKEQVTYSSPKAPRTARITIPGLPEQLLAKAEPCAPDPKKKCIIITTLNPLEL